MTFKEIFHVFLGVCSLGAMIAAAIGVLFVIVALAMQEGSLKERWHKIAGGGS